MTLIEHEARVGLPRMWEHPKRTRTRRGGVATSMVGGYTAILLGVPLDEVLYIIAHPETPAPHKDDFTPEFIEPLI